MSELNNKDYIQILEYYNKPIPKSKRILKIEAINLLSSKLCRCIKKVDVTNEPKSIGICTKSIINRKGFTLKKFTCRGKSTLNLKKKFKNNYTRRK